MPHIQSYGMFCVPNYSVLPQNIYNQRLFSWKEKVRSCFESYYKENALHIQNEVSMDVLTKKIQSAAAFTVSQEDLSTLQVKPATSLKQYPKLSHLNEVEDHVTGVRTMI